MILIFVGKLIGKYYDESGKATRYNKLIKTLLKDAENQKQNEDLEKRKFPPCNVEWNAEQGTKFWCTNRRLKHYTQIKLLN